MKAEKIYLVEFNTYTNCSYNTVSTKAGEFEPDFKNIDYLDIPLGGLLVRESELAQYAQFGQGFKRIVLVGSMYFPEGE